MSEQNTNYFKLITQNQSTVGPDNSYGKAIRYGLDGPGIEIRWRRNFPHPSRSALGFPSLLQNGYRVFPGLKRLRRGVEHPPHLAPRLKKEHIYISTHPLGLRGLF